MSKALLAELAKRLHYKGPAHAPKKKPAKKKTATKKPAAKRKPAKKKPAKKRASKKKVAALPFPPASPR